MQSKEVQPYDEIKLSLIKFYEDELKEYNVFYDRSLLEKDSVLRKIYLLNKIKKLESILKKHKAPRTNYFAIKEFQGWIIIEDPNIEIIKDRELYARLILKKYNKKIDIDN